MPSRHRPTLALAGDMTSIPSLRTRQHTCRTIYKTAASSAEGDEPCLPCLCGGRGGGAFTVGSLIPSYTPTVPATATRVSCEASPAALNGSEYPLCRARAKACAATAAEPGFFADLRRVLTSSTRLTARQRFYELPEASEGCTNRISDAPTGLTGLQAAALARIRLSSGRGPPTAPSPSPP